MDSKNTPPVPGPMGSQTDMAPYSLEYLVEKYLQISIFITSSRKGGGRNKGQNAK